VNKLLELIHICSLARLYLFFKRVPTINNVYLNIGVKIEVFRGERGLVETLKDHS